MNKITQRNTVVSLSNLLNNLRMLQLSCNLQRRRFHYRGLSPPL